MGKTEITILNIYTHDFVLRMWTQFCEALWSDEDLVVDLSFLLTIKTMKGC